MQGAQGRTRTIQSPYGSWTSIEALESEAKRISRLPKPVMNAKLVMDWRKRQLRLIGFRIRELEMER